MLAGHTGSLAGSAGAAPRSEASATWARGEAAGSAWLGPGSSVGSVASRWASWQLLASRPQATASGMALAHLACRANAAGNRTTNGKKKTLRETGRSVKGHLRAARAKVGN